MAKANTTAALLGLRLKSALRQVKPITAVYNQVCSSRGISVLQVRSNVEIEAKAKA